jgi:hypothetical protein
MNFNGSVMRSAEALTFCQTSPTAVIVTVWPTAYDHTQMARDWLKSSGAKVLYETEVLAENRALQRSTLSSMISCKFDSRSIFSHLPL